MLTTNSWQQETDSELIFGTAASGERFGYSADAEFSKRNINLSGGCEHGRWRFGGGLAFSVVGLRLVDTARSIEQRNGAPHGPLQHAQVRRRTPTAPDSGLPVRSVRCLARGRRRPHAGRHHPSIGCVCSRRDGPERRVIAGTVILRRQRELHVQSAMGDSGLGSHTFARARKPKLTSRDLRVCLRTPSSRAATR